MTVTPIQTTTPIPRPSDTAAQQLSGNFDTFLTLLTTQLKNQDPLSPMDSNEFTQQLVQFSAVEQQINANRNLETLIGLGKSQAGATAVSYLGKTITLTDGSAALQASSANWNYTLAGAAQDSVLTVADAQGKVVYVTHGEVSAGAHSFAWDGHDNAGTQLPDGPYKLTVTAIDAAGHTIASPVTSQGVVTEVDLTGDEPMLMIGPSMGVPLSKAALISNGDTGADTMLSSLTAPLTQPFDAAMSLLSAL